MKVKWAMANYFSTFLDILIFIFFSCVFYFLIGLTIGTHGQFRVNSRSIHDQCILQTNVMIFMFKHEVVVNRIFSSNVVVLC